MSQMTADQVMEQIAQYAALLASLTSPANAADVLRAMADEISGMQGQTVQ